MADRLDRALAYARSLASERAARPRRPHEYARRRPRQYGDAPLGETNTLPAGSEIARTRAYGYEEYRTLKYDVVLPSENVSDDECIINDDEWLYDVLDGWDEP